MDQEKITHALTGLVGWLETWRTDRGAYNGFVIHRTETKRMFHIHDTAWTQSAMIRGFANLARKSTDQRWHEALRLAADLQYKRYDPATGKYHFAGHEDDRFTSLVHCALANCALMEAGELLGPEKQEQYINAVRGDVERYWMSSLWVEAEGAFRFSEVDHYSTDEDRFVVNFNTMAAECLLKLSDLTGENSYRETALRVGDWLIEQTDRSRELRDKLPGYDKTPSTMPSGGLPYQFTPSQRDPDNCVVLYAGLALRGISALHAHTGDNRYAKLAEETVDFILGMRDSENHLFYHTTKQGMIARYPVFIAGAGMMLVGIDDALRALGKSVSLEQTVESLLDRQYDNGAFPGFIGKNRTEFRNGDGEVWEDVVAGVNWNAQLFEYLTRLIDDPSAINSKTNLPPIVRVHRRFVYTDTRKSACIIAWSPTRSMGIHWMRKKNYLAWISISRQTLARALPFLQRRKQK